MPGTGGQWPLRLGRAAEVPCLSTGRLVRSPGAGRLVNGYSREFEDRRDRLKLALPTNGGQFVANITLAGIEPVSGEVIDGLILTDLGPSASARADTQSTAKPPRNGLAAKLRSPLAGGAPQTVLAAVSSTQ